MLTVRLGGVDPPNPLTVEVTVKYMFFYAFPEGRRKKQTFNVQADRKGGGHPPGLTVSICENVDPFSFGIWFFDSQNRFYLMVKGLKNAFFMRFLSLTL